MNAWIRAGEGFDGVIDFEKVVQDPQNPLRIRADLTADFVHPNTLGYRLMGESIDLKLFETCALNRYGSTSRSAEDGLE